jgi:hypothetical protein
LRDYGACILENDMKRLIAVSVSVTTFALCFTLAPPALAVDGGYGVSPRNVVVNQSYENIRWTVGDSSGCWSDADASLEHVATREEAEYDFSSGLSGTFKFYDWNRYGRYRVVGTAWSNCSDDEETITPTYLTIKRAVRATLFSSRSGSYVRLAASVKRYDGGYPLWVKHRNASVSFQRKVNGVWSRVALRKVQSDGIARATVHIRAAKYYRAVVKPTSGSWDKTTNTVRK